MSVHLAIVASVQASIREAHPLCAAALSRSGPTKVAPPYVHSPLGEIWLITAANSSVHCATLCRATAGGKEEASCTDTELKSRSLAHALCAAQRAHRGRRSQEASAGADAWKWHTLCSGVAQASVSKPALQGPR